MKIDDVSLTIFTWDNIPATRYHLGSLASATSNLGLLRIHTDAGLEGHAFLGAATNPAAMDGPQLIRSLKPMLMGQDPLLLSFIVVIIGGLGSLRGTVVAAVLIGLSDGIISVFFSPTLAKIIATLLVAMVLVFRPQGLFGTASR